MTLETTPNVILRRSVAAASPAPTTMANKRKGVGSNAKEQNHKAAKRARRGLQVRRRRTNLCQD